MVVLRSRLASLGSKREVEGMQTFADKGVFDLHHLCAGFDFRNRFRSKFVVVRQGNLGGDCFARRVCHRQFEWEHFLFRHVVVGGFARYDGEYVVLAVVGAQADGIHLDTFRHGVTYGGHCVAVRFKAVANNDYLCRLFVVKQACGVGDRLGNIGSLDVRLLGFGVVCVQHRTDVVGKVGNQLVVVTE